MEKTSKKDEKIALPLITFNSSFALCTGNNTKNK